MEEETNNTSQTKDILSQNLVSKNETTPQLQKQKTKKVNNSREKDLANEILYFSINQDSK
jgi:hypothetical protein